MEDWAITQFRGDYRFLSNFYSSPLKFSDLYFPTVEHAYQAAKTLNPAERKYIAGLETAGDAKRAGQEVTIRGDWEQVKYGAMYLLVQKKFENRHLRDRLVYTRKAPLIEGNTWHDTYWGQCFCETHGMSGQNKLGEILMQVRALCVTQPVGKERT